MDVSFRERAFASLLFCVVGGAFSIPFLYSLYKQRKTPLSFGLFLYSILTVIATTSSLLFDFASITTVFVGTYHNLAEILLLFLSISGGKFRDWHGFGAVTFAFVTTSIYMLLPTIAVITVFGAIGFIVDIFSWWNWTLVSWENRKNPGTKGQRSGLYLLAIGSFLHVLGGLLHSTISYESVRLYLKMFLLPFTTILSIFIYGFALKILNRDEYDIKWQVVWWKWIPAILMSCGVVAFATLNIISKYSQ